MTAKPRSSRVKILTVIGTALAVIAAMTTVRLLDPPLVIAVRDLTFDFLQRAHPAHRSQQPIHVVDIDEASLAAFGQWPWPRTRLAQMTDRLRELGAAAIAIDIILAEADRTSPSRMEGLVDAVDPTQQQTVKDALARLPDHDDLFAQAIAKAPVVLGFAPVDRPTTTRPATRAGVAFAGSDPTGILAPFAGVAKAIDVLEQAASGNGGVSLSRRDSLGVVRRVPMVYSDGKTVFPSLVIEALRVAVGGKAMMLRSTGASGELATGDAALVDMKVGTFKIPLTPAGEIWMHYEHDRPDLYVPVVDLLDPSKEAEVRDKIEGQIVFIGTSAAGLQDLRGTSLGETMPGVSIHAQAAAQILDGDFLARPDWADGLEVVMTVLIGIAFSLALPFIGAYASLALGAVVAVLTIGGSWYVFTRLGLLIDPIFAFATGLVSYLAATLVLYVTTDSEKRFVRRAFGQYLSAELVAELERSPDSLALGGETREITLLFMDVRGFTSLSETLAPDEIVHFLNTLLSPLSSAIQAERGTIDKYIGDSIMAFWNAPLLVPDHAVRACRAALEMRTALAELNAADAFGFASQHQAKTVKIGIGLNTGPASVGNMGSAQRFNYSAIGDAVNVAARIESSSKEAGADILVSEETAAAAPDFAYLEVGEVALKGKARPAKLLSLVGDVAFAASKEFAELKRLHEAITAAIAAGDPSGAALVEPARALAPPTLAGLFDRHAAAFAAMAVQDAAI